MYPYKILVYLCSIADSVENDLITVERLSTETGETLNNTLESVNYLFREGYLTIEENGQIWPTSKGRNAASEITTSKNNTINQPTYQDWKIEALTGMKSNGLPSDIDCAVMPSGKSYYCNLERQLEARSELDKLVSDISTRLKLERSQTLSLLYAGAMRQPINDRGILLCPYCKEWQIVKWSIKTWHEKCIKCSE